jgi:hypothetical protein
MSDRLIDEKPCPVCTTGRYPSFEFGKQLCEKHDVCITCGCKRQGLGYAPWGVRYGAFQCKPCEKAERESGIKARISKGFSREYTDEVICPHCGYEHRDSWEFQDGEHDCPDCEKSFTLSRNVSVTYDTKKLEGK